MKFHYLKHAVSGAFGSFGNVALSFVGGFAGNMIDNAYTFTNAESVWNTIITSVIAGSLSGIGTAVSNRIAIAYYNKQLSNASSKTVRQIGGFMKNFDKLPSTNTKAFSILSNTNKIRQNAEKITDAIVILLGVFY